MLVSSLYNIVDQFSLGEMSVNSEMPQPIFHFHFPYPVSRLLCCSASAAHLLLIWLWERRKGKAVYYIGNSAVMLFGCGVILTTITLLFLEPLLRFFGSPDNVLSYAKLTQALLRLDFLF